MKQCPRELLYVHFESCAPPSEVVQLQNAGWVIHSANTLASAYKLLETKSIRVAVAELGGGWDDSTLDTLAELKLLSRHTQWLALVSSEVVREHHAKLAQCVAHHFFDYLTSPVDGQRLLFAVGHAYGMSRLAETASSGEPADSEEEIVGVSAVMRQLFRDIRKVAESDAPVFISGESGVGKELTVRAIHERSLRAKGPLVAVDCGALPPTLIHSELFGYEKGAFTGAVQRKIGRIEAAQEGTIFLDEIGDLPLDLQGNLLRFLQESTIYRIGNHQPIPVNVRVIAATHVDLELAVKEGRFREDLYFRLNVLHLRVPPLRERAEDIEVLARFFFKRFARDSANGVKGFTQRAIQAMRLHSWPGNVREMINRIHRAIVMCDGQWITPEDLGLKEFTALYQPGQLDIEAARSAAEKEAIHSALRACANNLSRAAQALGISRVTLYRLLEKYRIDTGRQTGPRRRRVGASPADGFVQNE